MTEADLYTVESLRPKPGRAWLAVCIAAACTLLGWLGWLFAEHMRAVEFFAHERALARTCADLSGGVFSNGKCNAPEVTFEVIPFSPGYVPREPPPSPGAGEPVLPILPHKEQETEL